MAVQPVHDTPESDAIPAYNTHIYSLLLNRLTAVQARATTY